MSLNIGFITGIISVFSPCTTMFSKGVIKTCNESKTLLSYTELILCHTVQNFNNTEEDGFGNILIKVENAGNQYFLLFPKCFPLIP